MTTTMSKTQTKGRILFVDDNDDWLAVIKNLLTSANYTIEVARDRGSAMQLLRKRPYHIALIDIRLDERDEANREGIELAQEMKTFMPELAIIFLTGYANMEAFRAALSPNDKGERVAFDLLEKKNSSENIYNRIEAALKTQCRVNPELDITLSEGLEWSQSTQGLDCLQGLDDDIAIEEITDLLRRIFFEDARIHVRPLHRGHSGASVLLTHATKTETSAAVDHVVVVKLDERASSKREADNVRRYVHNGIGGARSTHLLASRQTARLGGIAYSLVGAESAAFENFADVYEVRSSSNITAVLENLFKNTCNNWYKSLKDTKFDEILGAEYQQWLNLSADKVTRALRTVASEHLDVLSVENPDSIDNAKFILKLNGDYLDNPYLIYNLPFAYDGPFCLVHGDLNEGNILVDPNDETWLIDFYHTGPSHPVRDFAMLESAIKYTLLKTSSSPKEIFSWESALLSTNRINSEPEFPDDLTLDAGLQKATRVILEIRSLLHEVLPTMTIRDLRISLYFHALKAMTLTSKMNSKQRLHAFFCAGILTDLLRKS